LRSSIPIYNSLASEYEQGFYDVPHRKAYDLLAWEQVSKLLPSAPGTIVEAGCGAGRWVERLLALGHQVIGIEQAGQMIEVLHRRNYGERFTLFEQDIETVSLPSGSVDVVLAMGSLQYTQRPADTVRSFATWTKPGGSVCVLTDSLVALVLELLRNGKAEEAQDRLKTRTGVWKQHGVEADLHLFDRDTLEAYFRDAGLADVRTRGLLVTASAWGIENCQTEMTSDELAFLHLERTLSRFSAVAAVGKQILTVGRKAMPSGENS